MKEKLTSKQKKFALEFLISGNITDAAKKAGYSERSARQIGSLNLTKPNVVEYMSEILSKTKSEEVATTEASLRRKPQKQRKTTCHRSMKLISTQQIRIPTQHRLDPM